LEDAIIKRGGVGILDKKNLHKFGLLFKENMITILDMKI
jgi:hypothetical protein